MLNREPKEYTIASILNAAEGSLAPVACVSDGDCENAPSCKTYVLWKELDDVIEDFLSSKTLADILLIARLIMLYNSTLFLIIDILIFTTGYITVL